MEQKKKIQIFLLTGTVCVLIVIVALALSKSVHGVSEVAETEMAKATEAFVKTEPTESDSYQIENVHPILQDELKAGCETYACTMLLQILGFDVDEFTIADNYLICYYVFTAEDGTRYGPDMHSAFAGTAYAGWGVYAPSMAKSMNRYLDDQGSALNAYDYTDIPLETLCSEYVSKGVPVMIWATTDMDEPYVFDTWIVDYVDENAQAEIGDTVEWFMHEHCLVLIGYDSDNYYFADSTHGEISVFEKNLVAERYEQLGSQCIVVK